MLCLAGVAHADKLAADCNPTAHTGYVYLDGFGAAPVPEPETYGMMLAGLGLLGFVARRKRLAHPG